MSGERRKIQALPHCLPHLFYPLFEQRLICEKGFSALSCGQPALHLSVLARAQITAFPMGQTGWISPCFMQRKRGRQRLLLNQRIVSSDCPCVCRGGREDKEGLGEGKLC